jgi:hypothetical protein
MAQLLEFRGPEEQVYVGPTEPTLLSGDQPSPFQLLHIIAGLAFRHAEALPKGL